MQDVQTEQKAQNFADKCKESFTKLLFDDEIGFYDSSVSARDLSHRHMPSNNAIKWESRACSDLVAGKEQQCLDFYKAKLVSPAGLRPYPENCAAYDADANQLTCWWPVMSEFYTRLLSRFSDRDGMRQFIGWISYWTEKLTCPEGINCYFNEEAPPPDNWNCLSGVYQAYSVRGFYNAVIHSLVGADFDEEGMHLHPMRGEALTLRNLHFGKYRFDITVQTGKEDGVILNGTSLGNAECIPYSALSLENTVTVTRRA